MENLISLEMVEKSENQLRRRIFTDIQLNTLKKKLQKKTLNNNEKTYYYKFIKPKIKAMLAFFGKTGMKINGEEYIINNRIPTAIKILKQFKKIHKNKKIMISGSFLFSKKYNDIDVFIFTVYGKKDYIRGNVHVNFLPETALESLFFSSISQISVSNFHYNAKKKFVTDFNNTLQRYEILINNILNSEDYDKELRSFLIDSEYVSKRVVLNPKQLFELRKRIVNCRKKFEILDNILINAFTLSYDRIKLNKLKQRLKKYEKLSQQYEKAKNLSNYINTYKRAIEIAT